MIMLQPVSGRYRTNTVANSASRRLHCAMCISTLYVLPLSTLSLLSCHHCQSRTLVKFSLQLVPGSGTSRQHPGMHQFIKQHQIFKQCTACRCLACRCKCAAAASRGCYSIGSILSCRLSTVIRLDATHRLSSCSASPGTWATAHAA